MAERDHLKERFEPDVREHQTEGLARRIVLLAVWLFLFCQLVPTAFAGHPLSMLAVFALLFFVERRVWCVDVTPQGLRLWRILDRRVIPWQDIEEINYNGVTDEVVEVSYKGRFIRIPACVDHKKLTEAIELNTMRPAKLACHVDFRAPKYAPLLAPTLLPGGIRYWNIALAFGLAVTGIWVGWASTVPVTVIVSAVLVLVVLIDRGTHALNRAYEVRVTERGLGITTWRGHWEIRWTEIDSVVYAQKQACLRIKTQRHSFTLGHELTNFQDLLRAIEEHSAPKLGGTANAQ